MWMRKVVQMQEKEILKKNATAVAFSTIQVCQACQVTKRTSAQKGVDTWKHSLLTTNPNPQFHDDFKGFAQVGCR